MTPRQLIITLYVVVLTALSVAAGAAILDARAEYRQLKQIELMNRQRLATAEALLKEKEIILQRLKSDPEYVERAIRERLDYARPDDVIFRFPD